METWRVWEMWTRCSPVTSGNRGCCSHQASSSNDVPWGIQDEEKQDRRSVRNGKYVRNGIFLAISINKDVTVISSCSQHSVSWWALRELKEERIRAIQQLLDSSHSLRWALKKGNSECENGILDPDRWGYISKEPFQWAQALASSHT